METDLIGNWVCFQRLAIADLSNERDGQVLSRCQCPGQRIRHQWHTRPRGITCFGDQENTKLSGSRLPDVPNICACIANQYLSLIIRFNFVI